MSRRHIHLDVVGGIAGDMFVAAMTDAVPELRRRVLDDVAAVLPAAAGTPSLHGWNQRRPDGAALRAWRGIMAAIIITMTAPAATGTWSI